MALCAFGAKKSCVESLGLGAHRHGGQHVGVEGGEACVVGQGHGLRGGDEGGSSLFRKVVFAVEFAVEGSGVVDAGWRVDKQKLAVDVVLEDVARGSRNVGLTQALGSESSSSGIRAQELLGRGHASASLLQGPCLDVNAVNGFQEWFGHSLSDESHGAVEFSHLVNGQNAVADQVRLGEGEIGENKTRTIAENDIVAEVNGLEVLRLAWGG